MHTAPMPTFASESMDNRYFEDNQMQLQRRSQSPRQASPIYVNTSTARNRMREDDLFSYEKVESTSRAGDNPATTMHTEDAKPRSQAPVPLSHPYIDRGSTMSPEPRLSHKKKNRRSFNSRHSNERRAHGTRMV